MATVTKPIALDESLNTTEQTPRNVADVLAQELARIAGRRASDVNYDNTDSGLTADNVQDAIDELKSDIPTVNDGTLTIQQNGETKGTFTANQSGNSTVNIETPTTDIQTAVDEFSTYNGGLLSSLKVTLEPIQDLSHGDPSPTNICPISGHTQVDVDVSDGQTTQEQITVQIGQTVYGGNAELVSGVMDVNNKSLTFDGTESWWDGTTASYYQFNLVISDTIKYNTIIANELPSITISERGSKNGVIKDQQDNILRVSFTLTNTLGINSLSDFNTWLGNNNLQICYKLTSPTTINLTPQQIVALVGENHLSAPLEGQEITESKYKQMFTFDDVIAYIQSLS